MDKKQLIFHWKTFRTSNYQMFLIFSFNLLGIFFIYLHRPTDLHPIKDQGEAK